MSITLRYPFERPPAPGRYVEVAPGIRWLRMPLPFALDHINLWLLDDGDGWTLIDTGLNTDTTRMLWERHFESTLEGRPITRLLVTHFHPDHIGCAGWLVERWRPQFLTTRTEWLFARMGQSEIGADAAGFWGDFLRKAGLDEATVDAIANRGERYATIVGVVPRPFDRLVEGDEVAIGGRRWRVVIGTGHAPEMICLYAPEEHLFIAADQVLPRISPNVGVFAPEPHSNPLREFLETCGRLTRLSRDSLVLPMHGLPFYGLHERLRDLEDHHAERLRVTADACREPKTVAQLLPVLFHRELDSQQMQFAVGEALAHLNHLVADGRMARMEMDGEPTRFVLV